MKSTIKFLVMTMLLMLVITAFAGCSLFGHTWTEATCTAPKTCTGCGATEGEALGHTEQIIPAKEATCYETGLTEGKICSVCNEVLVEQKVVLSLGHDMVIDLPATATCTEPGLSAGAHCSRCDYKEEQTEIPALGHSYMFPCDAHCQVCGEFTNPNAAHTIVAVEAKAATCTANGNVAYWTCSDCGAAWLDEALTQVTNRMSVTLPATGHAYMYPCDAHCMACGELTNPNAAHTIVAVEAKAATCTDNGNVAYWYCSDCGAAWADEALTQVTNRMNVIIPALGHSYMFPCDAHCMVCGELTNPNAAHTIVAVEAKAATCTATGNIAYWYCSDCGTAWADEALTQLTNRMNVVIPTLDHTYMFACDAHCMVCGELTNPNAAHTINFVEGTPATCIATGTVDYYQCSICGYCWLDEALTLVANRMNVVIPTTGHDWELGAQGSTCTVCNLTVVAKIGDTYYETLEAALAAANGETIVLVGNVALAAPITIAKDDVVVIDLAGFVLSYESTTMNEAMITNLGSLTIKDSGETGEIFYNYVGAADSTYSKGNYTISNAGTLVIDGGKIHIATLRQHAKYPVNNNSTSGNATLIVNGGHLYNYNTSAIRLFCNSTTYTNTVIINGGLIEGYSAIWMQNPGKNTVNGQLTINGGEIRTTAAAYVNGSATVAEVASKIYCTAEGGAWDEASFIKITGGLFNENVNLETAAPAVVEIGDGATFNGYVKIHEHDFVGFSCETDGVCACGAIKPAAHTLNYVAAVAPANCLETGHDEYWECTACGAYFGDADGFSQLNPAWMFFTGDCVRPEDAADCATVPCTVCGEDTYGQGEHDVLACKGGLCSKCNTEIEGYGCQNYDTPACEDGFCFYCGDPVEGFGHENGAWAPCLDGECSYGCGLKYPATADHVDEDGDDYCDTCWNHLNHDVDPCVGGECSICWTYVEGAHTYAYPCDQICCVCYELTNPDATHTIVAVEAKAATCTDNGNIAYWYCSDCGAAWADEALTQVTNQRNVIIPAPGHSYGETVVAPTCTAKGYTKHTCGVCGDSYNTDEVEALGHNYVNHVCSACGEIEAGNFEVTNAEAVTLADGVGVIVKGIVISAETWNTTYKNMSVTIKDAEGNTLYIYRLATQVGLGDEVVITGKVGSYNGEKQIAQGATAQILTVHGDNHTYENGYCTVCGSKQPAAGETTVKCDFSTVSGTQYADETNTFGDVTVSTHNKGCHFNTQLRIYDSSSNNGYAVVKTPGVISELTLNMGYKAATLEVYGSTDGVTWTLVEGVTTSTSYKDYTVSVDASLGYTYLKLDAVGAQIRIANIGVTYAE